MVPGSSLPMSKRWPASRTSVANESSFARPESLPPSRLPCLRGELARGEVPSSPALPAVVQPPVGSRGVDVHAVRTAEESAHVAARWSPETELLVSRWIEGPSINVGAVTCRDRVCVGWPSVQILGASGCCDADWPYAYCGNDYAATEDLPITALLRLMEHVQHVGTALRAEGWLGAFGIDAILEGDDWYVLEINTRFQASTDTQSRLEREAETPPLVAAHLEAWLPGLFPREALPPTIPDRPLRGAQVLLNQSDSAPRIVGAPARPADTPAGFIWEAAPVEPTLVHPRAIVARWLTRERALDGSLVRLGDAAGRAVTAAQQHLQLEAR